MQKGWARFVRAQPFADFSVPNLRVLGNPFTTSG
jgi:hypothetical protein